MKCPYMTITVTKPLYTQEGSVTTVEFADCLKDLCPFFKEKAVMKRLESDGWYETVVGQVCGKVENDLRK